MRPGWRLTGLGLLFLGLFSLLTLRLWFLQVTEGQAFEDQAAGQQARVFSTPAPRGEIRDRDGVLLAGTRAALAVVVDRSLLSADDEQEVIQRLATLLDMAPVEVRHRFDEAGLKARFRLQADVTQADALFVREHAEDFPGVLVEEVPVRTYPLDSVAAHVIGYIGRPGEADLKREGIGPDDVIGKFGVEKQYDDLLRGIPGLVKFRVDANRDVVRVVGEQAALPGGSATLTIDAEIQAAVEDALLKGIKLAKDEGEPAIRAAAVVLDPRNGAVVAMASVPAYRPIDFVDGLTQTEFQELGSGAFNNFAIQGVYPPASAFKVVAYTMALEEGIFPREISDPSADGSFFCSGEIKFVFDDGSVQRFEDWKEGGHEFVNSHSALQQSCDLYFWEVALTVWFGRNAPGGNEELIQDWARLVGFGTETGVDLPFEQPGLVGDREWFDLAQGERRGRVRSEGPWSGGDVMNIVIGQGTLTTTPLQVANAYATLLNGGRLWQPRVVDRIEDAEGNTVFDNRPTIVRRLDLDPRTIAFLKEDLRQVVNGRAGTARKAFEDLDEAARSQIGGKTGTAEVVKGETSAQDIDTAWFVGVAPIDDPEYVVVVVIERGGSGGKIAAPTAREILEFLLLEEPPSDVLVAGEEAD